MRKFFLMAVVAVSACTTGPTEKGWTSNPGAQSFATAVAACNQISLGSTNDFTICMAGRGWSRPAR